MNLFICPYCGKSLTMLNRSLVCPDRHTFDLAKEGYVNLLPVNAKKSKDPGDNGKMMLARRDFLNSGHYEPLADSLSAVLGELTEGNESKMLDLGCGEGYYTGYIKQHHSSFEMIGLDISKAAVRYASKRYKEISFCVASAFEIPISNEQIDVILRIYAPSVESELTRTIKKGGFLVTVTPGKRHLYQLREAIYLEVHDHSEDIESLVDFNHVKRINLAYTMKLKDKVSVVNLLEMTPFGWKISEVNENTLLEQEHWEIDCDFNIDIFKKL